MIHFLSDLHLSPQEPDITRLFIDYLGGRARAAGRVFILGDLFEVWPGDDGIDDPDDAFAGEIVAALRALSDSGVDLAVMHGNRDFLLGKAFAERSGAALLPDPYLLELPTRRFVLSHGDALCTDDSAYLTFRAQVRGEAWQSAFLAKSLEERKGIANALRQQSEAAKREKTTQSAYVMDVNMAATENFLRPYGNVVFIHGHTHRPATHEHRVDGRSIQRWVLSDWHNKRGEILVWDGSRLLRETLPG